ncbi:hypothetical protein Sjap_002425 [Stephania japonica]|uniref:Cytochrome P450 n=1 Tax=Stephania japonica TaxID=461633 RepID=A0AAP0PU60_9MAGN
MATTDGILLSFICLICSFLIVSLLRKKAKLRHDIKHPPSPPALPFIGHLHHLSPVIHQFFHRLAQQFGPLIQICIGASTCVVASSAAVAKEIMKTHESLFTSRPKFGAADYDIYDGYSFITAEYGPYWRMVMSARCSGGSNEAKECRNLVMEGSELAGKLSMGDVLGPLKRFDLFGYRRKIVKLMKRFDKLVEEIMKEHEKEMKAGVKDAKDMMDILLDIHHDKSSETKLPRKGIKNIFEMFIAGTETSSTALQWTIAALINNPIVLRKLREEIDSSVGPSRFVQESDVPNLPDLQAIVKETLRLHTPAPLILRRCAEDCKINGREHRTAPDGHEGSSPPLHYIPFGSGKRGCPGASRAMTAIHGTLAALAQCFDFQVDKEGIDRTIVMEEGTGFTAGMKQPLICYPILRFSPL